jgi:hypothetical protein
MRIRKSDSFIIEDGLHLSEDASRQRATRRQGFENADERNHSRLNITVERFSRTFATLDDVRHLSKYGSVLRVGRPLQAADLSATSTKEFPGGAS